MSGRSRKNKKDLIDLIFDYETNPKKEATKPQKLSLHPKKARKTPTVKELRQEAKEKGFKGIWKLKKQELLDLLKKDQRAPPKKPTRPPPPHQQPQFN